MSKPEFSSAKIVQVTKSAIAQLTAKGFNGVKPEDVPALDSQYIVDLGEALNISDGVIDNNSYADIFFKSLINQIGKVVVDTRSYVAQLPSLFVDPVVWGLVSEHIMIDLSDVMVDEAWNPAGFIGMNEQGGLAEGQRIAGIEFGCYKPAVRAKLYQKAHGIMTALTIARDQMFTAFQGLSQYESFVSGLYASVENTIQLKAEIYALMTVSMGIAKAKANNNEINLLSEYKTATGNSTLTAAKALEDDNFLKFSLRRIAETRDYIKRFSAAYNNHEHVTFAPETELILLSQYEKSVLFMESGIYHPDKLAIGEYDRVASWQAVTSAANANPYNFATASSISLSATAAEEVGLGTKSGAGNITGVVAVLYDRYAMGITLDKRATTSAPCASRMSTNFFYHSLVNYIVNDEYPIVSFVIRD